MTKWIMNVRSLKHNGRMVVGFISTALLFIGVAYLSSVSISSWLEITTLNEEMDDLRQTFQGENAQIELQSTSDITQIINDIKATKGTIIRIKNQKKSLMVRQNQAPMSAYNSFFNPFPSESKESGDDLPSDSSDRMMSEIFLHLEEQEMKERQRLLTLQAELVVSKTRYKDLVAKRKLSIQPMVSALFGLDESSLIAAETDGSCSHPACGGVAKEDVMKAAKLVAAKLSDRNVAWINWVDKSISGGSLVVATLALLMHFKRGRSQAIQQ